MRSDELGLIAQCGHVLVVPCRRGAFAVNRHDTIMTPVLATYGEYGEDELQIHERYLRAGDVVVDVGANIGTHTVAFSDMVGPTGMVVSFEPVLCTYNLLCANVAFSGNQNVITHRAIVGDENRIRKLMVVDYNQKANFGMFNAIKESDRGGDRGMDIPEVTIDSLGLEECKLLKIDVEGSERNVLLGAVDTLKNLSPVVQAECNVGDKEGEAFALPFFRELGYHTFWLNNRVHRPGNYKQSKIRNEGFDRNILAVKEKDLHVAEGLEVAA